jgi:hypothetical protein
VKLLIGLARQTQNPAGTLNVRAWVTELVLIMTILIGPDIQAILFGGRFNPLMLPAACVVLLLASADVLHRTAEPDGLFHLHLHRVPPWERMLRAEVAGARAEVAGVLAEVPWMLAELAVLLAELAVLLAGRRRDYVAEAWGSDLARPRDPADGPDMPAWRRVAYAAGLIKAAVRYRIGDVADAVPWWRLADVVLASRLWSRLVLTGPCAVAVAAIIHDEGFYGLVSNADNLVAIGTVSVTLIYGGRKARKVTPKAARPKQDQA